MDESVRAVNVFAGYSGAQIALTAHSKVWKNRVDPDHACAAEKFWNWWIVEGHRVGVPEKPFADLADYVDTIAGFRPIFVKREGMPYLLKEYGSFADYYAARPARGEGLDGAPIDLVPEAADIGVHNSCYWYNARLTRYYTVENRINDEQPADALLVPSAISLGLVEALDEACEAIQARDWDMLRESRDVACRDGIRGAVRGVPMSDLSREMFDLATAGLKKRGKGEEEFLAPLEKRLAERRCPAEDAAEVFAGGGGEALVQARRL
jgi:gamma-glutamylcysteine synthetase